MEDEVDAEYSMHRMNKNLLKVTATKLKKKETAWEVYA
jgi:hypothetical protein